MANFDEKEIMKDEVTEVATCEPANNEVGTDSESSGISGKAIGMIVGGGITLGIAAVIGLGKLGKKLGKKYLTKHGWVKVDPPVEKDNSEDEVIDIDFDELDIDDPGNDEEETED